MVPTARLCQQVCGFRDGCSAPPYCNTWAGPAAFSSSRLHSVDVYALQPGQPAAAGGPPQSVAKLQQQSSADAAWKAFMNLGANRPLEQLLASRDAWGMSRCACRPPGFKHKH